MVERQFRADMPVDPAQPGSMDPVYGYAPPWAVFNRDQVPIELLTSKQNTIDNKGLIFTR